MLTGTLGMIPFYCSDSVINTFNKFAVKRGETFAEHKVIASKPVLEWTGHSLAEYDLDVRLDSTLKAAPAVLILAFKKLMQTARPQILLIGPTYYGTVVITDMSEDHTYFTGAGTTQVANVSLSLMEVADGWF